MLKRVQHASVLQGSLSRPACFPVALHSGLGCGAMAGSPIVVPEQRTEV